MNSREKNQPAIGLVMPLYNTERYVAEAIESVLMQTRRDWALVIRDDGSTDDSSRIAQEFAKQDSRIVYARAENRGIGAALKFGYQRLLQNPNLKYIGSVDSDDRLDATALEKTAGFLESNPEVGVVYTDHYEMNESGRILRISPRTKIPYSPRRLLIDFMTFQFRLMRREALEKVGGVDESFATSEDYDFCLRLSEVARFERLAQPLYHYRIHDGSISRANRMKQIQQSSRAVRNALQRRGMDKTHRLRVELSGRYVLRKKPSAVKS